MVKIKTNRDFCITKKIMAEISPNFKNICRTCMTQPLKNQDMLSIFQVYLESSSQCLTIADCLKSLTTTEFKEDDELPAIICKECLGQLNVAYNFKLRCEETNKILKLRLAKVKTVASLADSVNYDDIATSTKEDGDLMIIKKGQINACEVNTVIQSEKSREQLGIKRTDRLTCKICQRSFKQSSTLACHLRRHSTTRTTSGNRLKTYQCGSCTKVLTSSAGLAYHKQTHTDKIRSFKCEVCNKIFTSSGGLAYHKNVHSGVKNFSCDICSKRFVGHTNLLLHKRRHNREFSHLCSECGKKFLTFGELRRHMRKHTNERPFQCPICQKCFTTNVSLSQHKMRHAGEKPYLCYVCSKRFTTSANLNEHMRSHTGVRPHHCSVCNKGCISTSDLKKHLRTHSGEKPYICQECGKGFARSGSLKVHMRTHTGQKPYECSLCGKRFGHSGSLAKHVRKHEHAD